MDALQHQTSEFAARRRGAACWMCGLRWALGQVRMVLQKPHACFGLAFLLTRGFAA